LRRHLPRLEARIAAIYRKDQPLIPGGRTVIEAGDEVFYLAATRDIRQVMRELRRRDRRPRRILIAGGGNIGERLAAAIQDHYQVKLIETNEERAKDLGAKMPRTLVLVGEATDENLLVAEGIDDVDVFLALTNDDENNILSALLAKSLGAHKVLALINRRVYVDLVQADRIDIAVSPAQVSIGSLLAHVRRGDVATVHSLRLRRGAAEALELVVHGDASNSNVVGRRISDLNLPEGVTVGALVRGPAPVQGGDDQRRVLIAHHDTVIETEDHVILFLTSKDLVRRVERYFQVGLGFF
jgi:trk system potassium uptake protein TrkA